MFFVLRGSPHALHHTFFLFWLVWAEVVFLEFIIEVSFYCHCVSLIFFVDFVEHCNFIQIYFAFTDHIGYKRRLDFFSFQEFPLEIAKERMTLNIFDALLAQPVCWIFFEKLIDEVN